MDLIILILTHAGLFIYKNILRPGVWSDALQQDNYLGYVLALKSGHFSQFLSYDNSRLFPGLPFLMLVGGLITGLLLTLISLLVIYKVSLSLTKNSWYSLILTLFPPVVFEQTSKISTEAVTIALILSAYWLAGRKKYYLMSALLGYATLVRPISGCLFLAALFFMKSWKTKIKSAILYFVFPIMLLIFNVYHWGWSASFHQLQVYQTIGRSNLVVYQLAADIVRTVDWRQWRILFSGLIYVFGYVWLLVKTLRLKHNQLVKTWAILTTIFIFSLGPTPVLEEIRRFMAIFFPLALLVNYQYLSRKKLFFYGAFFTALMAFI